VACLLDSNVFITAKNQYYDMQFCPAFWEWLDIKTAQNLVFSVEAVLDELVEGDDPLADWAKARREGFFLSPDEQTFPSFGKLTEWTISRNFHPAAKDDFFQKADYYLVAYAHAHGHTVVTHEMPDDASKKRVKIPNACIGLGVKFMSPFKMLKIEKARFVLGR
jgi:hypothetical protein